MPRDLISKKTRLELREYFVSTSLAEIANEFDSADVPVDLACVPNVGGQRRTLVEQYYHSIDWTRWADVRKFLSVYENVLTSLEERASTDDESAEQLFKFLLKWIERDGFAYATGRLTPLGKHHGLEQMSDTVGSLDLPELHRQIQRMTAAVEDDPSLAIGTAKEMVESVCKTILEQRQIPFSDDADVGSLVKEVRKALDLVPEVIPSAAKGADTIKRMLSNLGTIAQGLGELRNLYGTGHGKGGSAKGLGPRHARLAVGAAATLSTFLFETHIEREAR